MYEFGSLVWVKRKNGRWWPARIVCRNEIPASFKNMFECSLYCSKLPIMLLGTSSYSLDWFNMESKRLKPFRCGEFDDCIKGAASSESLKCFNEGGMIWNRRKSACRREAILQALAIENKEPRKKLKRAGDAPSETVFKPKRFKSTCVSLKTQSPRVEKSPVRSESSIVIQLKTASTETPTHSSGDDHKNSAESSGHSQRQLKSMTVKKQGQSINWSKSLNCDTDALTNQNEKLKEEGDDHYGLDAPAIQKKKKFALKKCRQVMADQLAPNGTSQVVKKIFETEIAEKTYINSNDSALTDQQRKTQTMLVDVNVTVQKESREEHVPFICMTSRSSQKPIIGHPVDIEVLDNRSDSLFEETNGITKYSFGFAGNKVPKLEWKKAKRTPVLYSSTCKDGNTSVAIQSFSYLKAKGSDNPHAPQSVRNSLRKHTISSDHTLIHAVKNQAPLGANVNCVPVKHIFSRLLAAVG
ncbi:hypothetical protein LIER_26508 [Lithospermum erythrorhizon]|uniref:PWWP domain-containing protein n=1 Tax=Lithospermum erythrorhizon TaxID=34254 RepID=A0AAV3RC93_LITER